MGIYVVGKTYDPQLISKIGDISRFIHLKTSTAALAGFDPGARSVRAAQRKEQQGLQGLLCKASQDAFPGHDQPDPEFPGRRFGLSLP